MANKFLIVASFTITQNEVLKILEQETSVKFQITNVNTSDLEEIGDELAAKGSPSALFQYALQFMFWDGGNHAIRENDVKWLDLEVENLKVTIKKVLSEI
jgi:hypothetical protein